MDLALQSRSSDGNPVSWGLCPAFDGAPSPAAAPPLLCPSPLTIPHTLAAQAITLDTEAPGKLPQGHNDLHMGLTWLPSRWQVPPASQLLWPLSSREHFLVAEWVLGVGSKG